MVRVSVVHFVTIASNETPHRLTSCAPFHKRIFDRELYLRFLLQCTRDYEHTIQVPAFLQITQTCLIPLGQILSELTAFGVIFTRQDVR